MDQPNPRDRLFERTISTTTLCLALCCLFSSAFASNKCYPKVVPGAGNFISTTEVITGKNYEPNDTSKLCTPLLGVEHYSMLCLNQANTKDIKKPVFNSECSHLAELSFEDEYINLGCSISGFGGYFQPSNWAIETINGDGGVDVTGAPNVTLVEGANKALVKTAAGSTTNLKIVIPATGFATFDWSNFGGSTFFYSLLVNGKDFNLSKEELTKGSFRTPLLRVGDLLEFQMKASDDGNDTFELSNFNFYSNSIALVKRHWTALDSEAQKSEVTQLIAIEKANITDVIFPPNRDGLEAPILKESLNYSPEYTGYPVIDRDGDMETLADQYPIKNDNCTLHISYSDEWSHDESTFVINRKWIITDQCSDSQMEETQFIKLDNIPASKVFPKLELENTMPASKITKRQDLSSPLSMHESLEVPSCLVDKNYDYLTRFTGLKRMAISSDCGIARRCKTIPAFSFTTAFPFLWDQHTVVATFQTPPPKEKIVFLFE